MISHPLIQRVNVNRLPAILFTAACTFVLVAGCGRRDNIAEMQTQFEKRFVAAIESQNGGDISKLFWLAGCPKELSDLQVDLVVMFSKSLERPKVEKMTFRQYDEPIVKPVVFDQNVDLNLQPIGTFHFEVVNGMSDSDGVVTGEFPIGVISGTIYFCGQTWAQASKAESPNE